MFKKPEVLIFDCGGVLVDVNKRMILKNLSLRSLLPQLIANRFSIGRLLGDCLNELHRIKPLSQEYIGITDEYNNQLPTIVCEWLLGIVPNAQLLNQIKDFIATDAELNKQSSKKDLLLYIAESTLDSQRFVSNLYLYERMMRFLERCIQEKNRPRIYLFSNYNDEAFELMLNRFDRLRKNVDGYFVSGKERCAKPHDEFYDRFMQRFDINPDSEACYLIDDQLNNRITGIKKGIVSLHPNALHLDNKDRFHLRLPNNYHLTW